MSFCEGSGVSLCPLEFLKACVETYTRDHGKAPKLLVISEDDMIDWKLSGSFEGLASLNLKVTTGKYLKPGQFDLCMGIKDES
jgi:hypothetical protein